MKSKTAIITGAASGIGLSLAEYFASEGYNLALIDIDEIPSINRGVDISIYKQDISDFDKTAQCIKKILKNIDHLAVLVNNAGILKEGFLDLSLDDAHKMLHTDTLAHFNITKHVAHVMQEQKAGYIFNIVSRSGLDATPDLGMYSICKFGLMAFNEALYEAMAKYNVKVSALCPSVVNTPMGESSKIPEDERIPTRDIVNTVNYLLHLSENTYIREMYIDCHASMLKRLAKR